MHQNDIRGRWRRLLFTAAGVLGVVCTAGHVQAASFELIYTGAFNTQDALNLASQTTPTFFTTSTPFTIQAWFDTNSPNLAPTSPPGPPPFAGFHAYSPSLATIDIAGQTYTFDTITTNPTAGLTVAIFDQNSFTPGRYAVGILQQPPQDGAGIIGDFSGASPNFTVDALVATTFTGYNGVGYGSGVCLQGSGANCQLHAITPFVLHSSTNQTWALTLGNYDEAYPLGSDAGMPDSIPGPLNTAQLVAVPEPGTWAAAGVALTFLFGFARRRRN